MSVADNIVAAARSWIGTPYRHHAKVKGAGADCIQLVLAAHEEAGLVSGIDTGIYSTDWFLHRDEEKYLAGVEASLRPVDGLELSIDERSSLNPAWRAPRSSVFVVRVGRTFSHGGIVTDWPFVIHASQPSGVVEEVDISLMPAMRRRPMRFYIHEEALP